MRWLTAIRGPGTETGAIAQGKKNHMATARIARMLNELHADPCVQCFAPLLGSALPGGRAAAEAEAPRGILATLVAQRVQRSHHDRLPVHLEKAA